MSTRSSSLPTDSVKSAMSVRICSGLPQLRRNRMRPQGRAAAKKARSASSSAKPAQPEMKALRSTRRVNARRRSRSRPVGTAESSRLLGHHQAIGKPSRFQRTAQLARGRFLRYRADAQPIPCSLGAKIGLLHDGPVVGEQGRVFLLHIGEARERLGLVLLRADLNDVLDRTGSRLWRCRCGLLRGRLRRGLGRRRRRGLRCSLLWRGWRRLRLCCRGRRDGRELPGGGTSHGRSSAGGGSLGRKVGHGRGLDRDIGPHHHRLYLARAPIRRRIFGRGDGYGRGARQRLRGRRDGIGRGDRRRHAGSGTNGSGAGWHGRHGYFFLARHELLGLRRIAILQAVVDQLVLVREFLATGLIGRFLDGRVVGLDQGRRFAAKAAAALLVSNGKRAPESNCAEKRASDHEGAPALEREAPFGRRAGRRHLRPVEEIGIETLALIVILRRAPRRFGRTERDLRRLIVDCIESLELAPRIDLRHGPAVILRRLVGEEFEALFGTSGLRIVSAMGLLPAARLVARKRLLGETRVQPLLLREARVGEARLVKVLVGELRVGKVLIETRFRETRIAPALIWKVLIGEALVLIGLALEVVDLVITRGPIGLGPGMLGAAEARRLKRLVRLAAKVRGLIVGRRTIASRDALRGLVARGGAGLRALVARRGLCVRTRIVQGRLRAWVAKPRIVRAWVLRKRLAAVGRIGRRRLGDLRAQIGAGKGRVGRHLCENGAAPAKHRSLSGGWP